MQPSDHSAYAFKEGQLVHIADVPRGLSCGCSCVRCNLPLVARKGNKRQHHFAHAVTTGCPGATETILHLLTKEILSKLPYFSVPPYEFCMERTTQRGKRIQHKEVVAKGGVVPIDYVAVEQPLGNVIPDIQVVSKGKTLIVEVAVTHKVGQEKQRKLRRQDLPAIEIGMDWRDSLLSRAELAEKLQNQIATKVWLFHPKQREAEQEFYRKWRAARSIDRRQQLHLIGSTRKKDILFPDVATAKHQVSLTKYDRIVEAFQVKHGRYPDMAECLKLWPDLWSK